MFRSLDAEMAFFGRIPTGLLVVGALALLAGLGFAAVLARAIARPIRRPAAASRAVRGGDLETQGPVTGSDETAR